MWQECPICRGSGVLSEMGYSDTNVCTVCEGKKIISEVTGLPPIGDEGRDENVYKPIVKPCNYAKNV